MGKSEKEISDSRYYSDNSYSKKPSISWFKQGPSFSILPFNQYNKNIKWIEISESEDEKYEKIQRKNEDKKSKVNEKE